MLARQMLFCRLPDAERNLIVYGRQEKERKNGKLAVKFYRKINNIRLSRKLVILYVFCVLLPLIATDSVLLYIVRNNQQIKQFHAMENAASAMQYSLTNSI